MMKGETSSEQHERKKPHLMEDILTELGVICATAGKWGKLNYQPCGLILICWNKS